MAGEPRFVDQLVAEGNENDKEHTGINLQSAFSNRKNAKEKKKAPVANMYSEKEKLKKTPIPPAVPSCYKHQSSNRAPVKMMTAVEAPRRSHRPLGLRPDVARLSRPETV